MKIKFYNMNIFKNVIYSCDSILNFKHYYFSFTAFRKHSNMLITSIMIIIGDKQFFLLMLMLIFVCGKYDSIKINFQDLTKTIFITI